MSSDTIRTIRSLEDVQYLLNILFTNLNNLDRTYYDMFINPVPMDIELERYDEKGTLTTVTLPNRAKDKLFTYIDVGDPNGQIVAPGGSLYLDQEGLTLWYKSNLNGDSREWIKLLDVSHFIQDINYLTPTSLLNTNNLDGIVKIQNGGTGVGELIEGLVFGDSNTQTYRSAVAGQDYFDPSSLTGMIAFYPVPLNSNTGKEGWLKCNGASVSKTTYSRLYEVIGNRYGESGNNFNVPDLRDYFIRCHDDVANNVGSKYNSSLGPHKHSLSGLSTGDNSNTHNHPLGGSTEDSGEHSHTIGYTNFENYTNLLLVGGGVIPAVCNTPNVSWGSHTHTISESGSHSHELPGNTGSYSYTHNHTLSGSTNDSGDGIGTETSPKNIILVPLIKY